ncbi:hypothetical protein SAMN05660642_00599 [Geodermatophilus siccatus]|uniref:Uncharacterized protein n=1 Tax=Geodermatophilus siccatus TaxID=1137991 RepID=A0A1G9LUI1_9ACTN|nr:hypothetical protein [Geodermatophilus siccatus]SDL65619.1 hypothetical protein SAMN05660642_00599 [Geodermatophilus siccatus]
MAMRAAVVDRMINADPSAGVPLARAREAAVAMTSPAVEEVGRALDVASTLFRPFIAVCALAGLRLEDVDFLRRTTSVRHQLQGGTNSTSELVAPGFVPERVVHAPAELIAQTYAGGLIASDYDVVTVQRALGPSSATITFGVYATSGPRPRTARAPQPATWWPPRWTHVRPPGPRRCDDARTCRDVAGQR